MLLACGGLSLILLVYVWLGFRIWKYRLRRGDHAGSSAWYAVFTVIGKLPNAIGMLTYWKNHKLGKQAKIIEYKSAEGATA